MHLHLYRPVMWWDGMAVRVARQASDLPPRLISYVLRCRLATWLFHPSIDPGDSMSNDRSSLLRLITAPTSEPVSLTQAKTFLRVEHTADDTLISSAIAAARYAAESYLRAALLPQTWEYTVANPNGAEIRLPFGPAQSITSITLTNEAGTTTTMASGNYRLSVDGFTVLLANPPSIEKLKVTYSASSYTSSSAVPALLAQGMLHHIAAMYENRDGDAPMPVQSLTCYQPFRRVVL